MAIEGPLRELGLADLLQLLHLCAKTGTLSLRSATARRAAAVYLEDGTVVGARSPGDGVWLGQLLVHAGKVTPRQLDQALARQREHPGKLLGSILVEAGAVSPDDVQTHLRFQVEEVLFELLNWTDGYFYFEEGPLPALEAVRVRLAIDALLMESARRLDEWIHLTGGRSGELVPRLADEEPERTGVLTLEPAEWEVLAVVDGERTLRAIARVVGQGEVEVARAVLSLVSAGVVEVGPPAPEEPSVAPPATGAAADATGHDEVGEALRGYRLEEAEREVERLAKLYPDRAEVYVLRARVAVARGEWWSARESLEWAIQTDPVCEQAYYQLGFAAARMGDLARAAQAMGAYLRLAGLGGRGRDRGERLAGAIRDLTHILEEGP